MLTTKSNLFSLIKNELVLSSYVSVNELPFKHIQKNKFSNGSVDTATMRRGTGGRSSFSGLVVTVFGGTGFFGKYLINELGKIGSQIIIPHRSPSYDVKELRLMGDLGQIVYLPFEPENDDDIRKAVKYSNVVVNLIGKNNPTKNWPFQKVHVDLSSRIARICKEMGVEKLVHMSTLNATTKPKPIITSRGSDFLRTKANGEIEVRREFPEAVIVRPADIYGQNDHFLFYYTRRERRIFLPLIPKDQGSRYLPLWRKGKETFKEPVFATDAAKALMHAIKDPHCKGLTLELSGPDKFRLDHLIYWIYMTLRYSPERFHIIDHNYLFTLKTKYTAMLRPIYPYLSTSRYEREFYTDELLGLPNLKDLGVTNPTKLEDRLKWEIGFKSQFSYYWSGINDFPEPLIPPKYQTV